MGMQKTFRSLLLLMAAMLLSINAYSQDDRYEKVRFARGASSTTIKSSITGYQSVNYTLDAKSGQNMTVKLKTNNGSNYFNIYAPGKGPGDQGMFNSSTSGNSFSGVLPASGTYTISVYLMRNAARRNETANYTLDVGVTGSSSEQSVSDGDGTAAVIAAAALLGIAALSHHDGHYEEGKRYDDHREKAEFERGYRDGLHNARQNDYNRTQAYRDGFKSGQHERDLRISHNQRNQWKEDRHAADGRMKRKALHEAEKYWGIARGSATPVSSTYNEKNGRYRIKVAAGYHHGVVVMDKDGNFIRFVDKEN